MNSKLKNLIFTCAGKGARIPFVNSLRLRGAKLSVNRSIVLHTRIDCKGKNNTIHFEDGCILNKCRINIRGDNNEIYFHKGICAEFTELWIEDDNNQIVIGENAGLYRGNLHQIRHRLSLLFRCGGSNRGFPLRPRWEGKPFQSIHGCGDREPRVDRESCHPPQRRPYPQ